MRLDAGRHILNLEKAAHHQARAGKQYDAERDFRDHQAGPRTAHTGRVASARLQIATWLAIPPGAEHGQQTKHDARERLPILDRRTAATDHLEARAHLASCPDCQREFAAFSQTAPNTMIDPTTRRCWNH